MQNPYPKALGISLLFTLGIAPVQAQTPIDAPSPPFSIASTEENRADSPPVFPTYSTQSQDLYPEPVAQNEPEPETSEEGEIIEETPISRPAIAELGRSQRWTIEAEAVFLDRDIDFVPIAVDTFSQQTFGTDSLDFDFAAGTRLKVGYHFNPTSSLSFSYLGLHDWSSSATVTANFVPVPPGGESLQPAFNPTGFAGSGNDEDFTFAYQNRLRYTSELSNLELNYEHNLKTGDPNFRATLIAGLRYAKIDENLELLSIDEDPNALATAHTGRYAIATNNDMFGLQIGADLGVQLTSFFGLDLKVRAGALVNSASQDSVFANTDGNSFIPPSTQTIFQGSNSNTDISPIFELSAFATVDFSPNVSLRAGMNFLYLGNVALAPQQFAPDTNFPTNLAGLSRSSATYFGPSVGLLFRF